MPAEIAGQRPLLAKAVAGDREAFGKLYDAQVEGVYRYLLAWTGDRSTARELTEQVFRGALAWLPVTAGGDGDFGAWLVAMARDAVAQPRPSGGLVERRQPPGSAVEAVARLGDPEREVVVLRLLLGHSLAHTAHLSGYSQRAVMELQLAACLAVWELTGARHGGASGPEPSPAPAPLVARPMGRTPAGEFERRLGRWEVDLTGDDPALADALAVASSLRLAVPGYVVAPDLSFVERLREQLVAAGPGQPDRAGALHPAERAPVAAARVGGAKRPWIATGVATTATAVILTLQAFGNPAPPSACDGQPCPAPTTVQASATGASVGTPLTTVLEPTTTASSLPGLLPPPTAPPASAPATPPSTRPATTAPQTTGPPRSTTTRAPTTTAPTTTTPPTTTTTPPTST